MASPINTTSPEPTTNELSELIAEHRQMMVAYEALYEVESDAATEAQELLYRKLLETRKTILTRRPRTLEEVAMKATLMASDRAFNFWDIDGVDVESHFPDVLTSLIPEGMDYRAAA